ncbi:hypothetical protein MiSe_68900 [Microseira wollei NIES-4236]|uniref:Uncharacterized protein n=1 Tax=Microseira wollei NIES-4236 TaxID=2530354 RepID=A0AAV3XKM6_9CYAN|nr:hypothetical protein MiSe_68900 [Microseira wollei NIES-4236]
MEIFPYYPSTPYAWERHYLLPITYYLLTQVASYLSGERLMAQSVKILYEQLAISN